MPKKPDLIVSGINSGTNIGIDITRSGTVGAALEAANYGIPAMAVSLETDNSETFSEEPQADFRTAAYFCRFFAAAAAGELGADVHILKIEVPAGAGHDTAWELTTLSKSPYYFIKKTQSDCCGRHSGLSWYTQTDFSVFTEGTDAHCLLVRRRVALTPLSLDLTSRVPLDSLKSEIQKNLADIS